MLAMAVIHVVRAERVIPALPPPVLPGRAPFECTVSGVGTVEARTENIEVGSALCGVVLEVYVPVDSVGQRVKAGTPLFRVDDRVLRAELRCCEADLAAAEAEFAKLENQPRPQELAVTDARVRVARANMELASDLYQRGRNLYTRQAMSTEDYAQRQLNCEAARKQLDQVQAEYDLLKAGAWEADKVLARAHIAQSWAKLEKIKTELERVVVRAPLDGAILRVNVRPGEYLGTPPARPPIVLGDVGVLHVRVEIDEQDIFRFRPRASARAFLRSHPKEDFPLTFVRVEPYVVAKKSLVGDGAERVDTRVLQVIYSLDAGASKIYVGQQLDVFIDADAEELPKETDKK
jgi:multidrug resistance efflux pump